MNKTLINHEFWKGKRVLLTGHTGFKGGWLSLWLSELEAQITGVSLEPNKCQSLFSQLNLIDRVTRHHIADIRDQIAISNIVRTCQPEVVFHLAAQPLVQRSYQDPLGTWSTNLQGSLNILEALKGLDYHCAVVMVTTDKVYENQNWLYGYRENDPLGGHDPYSASKAAAEIAIRSWRKSFCGQKPHQSPFLAIATARAGNVIGGGDWAEDRIIPDAMKAIAQSRPVQVRNPEARRPWQHVLEPLRGYLCLAQALAYVEPEESPICSAFNFGPALESNKSVRCLIEESLKHWPGSWEDQSNPSTPYEAERLHLQIDKAKHLLGWEPVWGFAETVQRTVSWYKVVHRGSNPLLQCIDDIKQFHIS